MRWKRQGPSCSPHCRTGRTCPWKGLSKCLQLASLLLLSSSPPGGGEGGGGGGGEGGVQGGGGGGAGPPPGGGGASQAEPLKLGQQLGSVERLACRQVASKASLVDQNHRPQPLPSRHNQLHWLSRGAHHHSIGNDMAKLNVYVWNLFLVKITMTLWRLTLQSLSFGNDHQCYIFLSLNRVWMHVSISVILWWHSVPSYFIPFIKFLLPHVWPHIKYCWD